jgi:hypothetical protein
MTDDIEFDTAFNFISEAEYLFVSLECGYVVGGYISDPAAIYWNTGCYDGIKMKRV